MANDSTNAGQVSSEQDTTPINDGYFTDMQGDADAVFGPEQLAQTGTGGAPVVVPVPQDQNVIRVQVNPGEILELSSPFDPGATLLGREADGNLAIRVGDVTVILVGFVEANAAAPVVVETSDGQPVDIAVLLASTDPAIDIQTAAGPGEGPQGQGADNTGAILAQLANGNGLGGLNAVGGQDATELSYGLIDNSIRLDRDDALTTATTGTSFRGLAEPFLRDPFNDTTFTDFTTFFNAYGLYVNGPVPGNSQPGWADFQGTTASGTDLNTYLSQTSFTNLVTHSSTSSEPLYLDVNQLTPIIEAMTSDQHHLYIDPVTVDNQGHATTVFVRREGDDALILVIHAHEAGHGQSDDTQYSGGNYEIDTFLINRVDHQAPGQDILDLNIPFVIPHPAGEGSEEQPQEIPPTTGSVQVQIQDDVPILTEIDYYSFLHATSFKDALDCFNAFLGGKITDVSLTHDKGLVDEDYIFGGNHDKDNANGPDEDPVRGDESGDRFLVGRIEVNFGADGPEGKIPAGDGPSAGNPYINTTAEALAIAGLKVGDPFTQATSQGHDLVVLKHEMLTVHLPFPPFTAIPTTIEIVQVGYTLTKDTPSGEGGDARTLTDSSSCNVVVFTLLLQTGPNVPLFGGFLFEQCEPLDHAVGATLETSLPLSFEIVATDDDGDHTTAPIILNIQVNDDAPTFLITYNNENPTNCAGGDGPVTEGFVLTGLPTTHVDHYTTKDFGHVDEDWLNGGVRKEALVVANGQGNHDLDGNGDVNANEFGDDKGGVQVCGRIDVNFGADGPSDAENNGDLALKTYDTSDPQNLPLFVNGGDPTPLTSDGHPLVVLQSSPGHLLVGYTTTYGEGSEPYTINHPVFELCLNADTGKFEFNLLAPIDHVPSTVDGEPESNLVLSFDVGAAEDFDGDKALGAINIKVNDDKPEVGITYCNETPGAIPHIFAVGTSHDTDFGRIDEDWLKDAPALTNGSFESPTVLLSFDELDGPGGLDGWTIGAPGVDHIGSYWQPSDGSQSLDLSQHDAGSISRELTGLTVGREYTVYFDMAGNPDGGDAVVKLQVSVGSDAQSFTFDTTGHSKAAMGWEHQAFTFVATSDTQTLTFTSETPGAFGPALDNVTISSSYDGNQDLDANGDSNANQFGDDYGSNHLSGDINMKYGADGPGTQVIGLALLSGAFTDAGGLPLFSGGNALVVLHSDAELLTVGYGTTTVLTLTLDEFGHFDFTQSKPLDHPIESPIEDNVNLAFNAGSIIDGDGDTVNAVIKIQVNDDVPEAGINYTNHADTSEDGDFTTTAFGMVDEDFLGDPPANTDNDNNPFAHADAARGDTFGTNSCYGSIGTIKFGADGPVASPFALTHLSGDFNDADDNPVTQSGQPLVVLDSTDSHLAVGLEGGSPVFELTLNADGTFNFQLYGPLDETPGTDPVENNLMLAFNVAAPTDGDGDPVHVQIKIQVNDDGPVAADDCENLDTTSGNLLNNDPVLGTDKPGADGFRMTDGLITAVTHIKALDSSHVLVSEKDVADTGDTTIQGLFGVLTLFANGNWSYELDDPNVKGSDIFEYTLTDGDGDTDTAELIVTTGFTDTVDTDTFAARLVGPTHEPAPSYDHDVTVTGANGIVNPFTSQTYHFEDSTGGHVIFGGAGNDYINVTGTTGAVLSGNGGDDIIHGGDGKSVINGGGGDDTLFGGNNDDSFFGGAGHDAMSGGDGNDTFFKVDADDLDGTNTLDGIHSIDGGTGTDTVDLSVLKTFDSSQAMHLENVEHLALEGKAAGGGGTAVTLNYGAAYGITEVGGLHQLSITGDKSDTLNLQASGGNAWHETGVDTHIYEAGIGASQVRVTVDHDIAVQVS